MTDRPTTEAGRHDPLSVGLVATEMAKTLLARPKFAAIKSRMGALGDHVAVNGHDIARVEAEARAALIDELVAAVKKEPGLTVTEFYNEPDRIDRAAVLRLLEGARHGK